MPTIIEDIKLKQVFLDNLTKSYSNQKEGLFVTDFVGYCLRKSYWRRVKPKPIDEKTLGYFVDGNRRHETLQDLAGFKAEVSVQKYGLRGRIDMIGEYPIEIKSTRSTRTEEVNEHYLKQLITYCLMTETNTCILMVQFINSGCWKFHKITFTADELVEAEDRIIQQVQLLKDALEDKDPNDLPYPPTWECKDCQHKEECYHI